MIKSCRFLEYEITVDADGTICLDDIEADKLGIKSGDTMICFVDPETKAVTMKHFDIDKVEKIYYEES
jgi:hypothetical protein